MAASASVSFPATQTILQGQTPRSRSPSASQLPNIRMIILMFGMSNRRQAQVNKAPQVWHLNCTSIHRDIENRSTRQKRDNNTRSELRHQKARQAKAKAQDQQEPADEPKF